MNAGNTKRETELARGECEKLRTELRYEIDKIAASQRLDLNLEKVRAPNIVGMMPRLPRRFISVTERTSCSAATQASPLHMSHPGSSRVSSPRFHQQPEPGADTGRAADAKLAVDGR